MVALPRYYHGGNMGPEERNIACTHNIPFLRSTEREFDHKFVGSLWILNYSCAIKQIKWDRSWTNISFLMRSTPGQLLLASINVLGTSGNKNSLSLSLQLPEEQISKLHSRSRRMRVDEVPKQAFSASTGQVTEPLVSYRSLLDPVMVDHFLNFMSSSTFLRDIAYGTKSLKFCCGEKIESPNMKRAVMFDSALPGIL